MKHNVTFLYGIIILFSIIIQYSTIINIAIQVIHDYCTHGLLAGGVPVNEQITLNEVDNV